MRHRGFLWAKAWFCSAAFAGADGENDRASRARRAAAFTSRAMSGSAMRGSASSTSPAASSRWRTTTAQSGSPSTAKSSTTSSCARDLIARGHRFRNGLRHRGYPPRSTRTWDRTASPPSTAISPSRSGTSARRRLMLARDRMGVRPLYLYPDRTARCCSPRRSRRCWPAPACRRELDPIALDQIFTFWFPLAPRTVFKDISELPPAHVLIADANGHRRCVRTGGSTIRDAWRRRR